MKKKLLIFGMGAQGTAVAMHIAKRPDVESIICADEDKEAIDYITQKSPKITGVVANADDMGMVENLAQGVDLIINGLPSLNHINILDAAVKFGTDYQDFTATDTLADTWPESIEVLYNEYGRKFADKGRLAIVGTGSSPGLICLATRKAVDLLDSCDSIINMFYEGVYAKRGIPFWWSPADAIADMSEKAYIVRNGELLQIEPFTEDIERTYACTGETPLLLSEHYHDEPVHYWLNREKFFKNVQNISFKYGGAGMDFAKPLYESGRLSHEETYENGETTIPFDIVKNKLPPAPKYSYEIEEILQEGLHSDFSIIAVEAYGRKNGKERKVETVISFPGLKESYEKAGITSEMFITGQSAALFTELFLEGRYKEKGLISSDMLPDDNIDHILSRAVEIGIELNTYVI